MREIMMRLRRKLAEELQQPQAEFKLSLSVSDGGIVDSGCTEYRLRIEMGEMRYTYGHTVLNSDLAYVKFDLETEILDALVSKLAQGINAEKESQE